MAQPQAQWKINIVGHDVKPASWFLGNEKNVKIHPHAQSAITEGSLNELGWLRPVIVNKRTAEAWGRDRGVETLLDGHDRIKLALRRDEATPIPLDYVDLTPAEEDLALLILDEMTGMALKDKEKLSQLMYTTKPSDAALVQALADMAAREGLYQGNGAGEVGEGPEPQIDRAAELREQWGTEVGQVWRIESKVTSGSIHRICCGDSTKAPDVVKLLDGASPIITVTDPPYGVDYNPAWRQEAAESGYLSYAARRIGEVANDDRVDWLDAWQLCPGPVIYCWHADRHASTVQQSLELAGFEIRCQIIWGKPHFPISRGHYHWRHEPCWYAVRQGETAQWLGDHKQTTLWDDITLDRNADGGHGTQKPMECMARPIRNHRGDVYDPFLGSGTTMVAAEQLGRVCYGMEIEPKYVAVTLQRMADMGLKPRLVEG